MGEMFLGSRTNRSLFVGTGKTEEKVSWPRRDGRNPCALFQITGIRMLLNAVAMKTERERERVTTCSSRASFFLRLWTAAQISIPEKLEVWM